MPFRALTLRPRLFGAALAAFAVPAAANAQTAGAGAPVAASALPQPVREAAPAAPPFATEATSHQMRADYETALALDSPAKRAALRDSQEHEEWIGWQTLAVDSAAIGLPILLRTGGPILAVSGATIAFGSPIVHFVRGDVAKGFGSVALRVTLPLLGYLVGTGFHPLTGDVESGVLGAGAGAVCASAVDASLLGWDRWQGSNRVAQPVLAMRVTF
jgi:hypothetical protein